MSQSVTKQKPLTPLLKWAGGKSWLIPKMREIYAPYRSHRWVEPFCGSLALPLALQPDRAFLTDINGDLINLYNQIKNGGFEIDLPYQNTDTDYYLARSNFNCFCDTKREKAELFLYLNRHCFNGLCRYNRKGEFNTPYGRYEKVTMTWDFDAYSQQFKRWMFGHLSYREVSPQDNDFVYLDPPYDDGFTGYSGNSFGWWEQESLIEWARHLKCPVAISNKATDRIMDLYDKAGFEIQLLNAPRSISSNGDRKPVKEVLAIKNL